MSLKVSMAARPQPKVVSAGREDPWQYLKLATLIAGKKFRGLLDGLKDIIRERCHNFLLRETSLSRLVKGKSLSAAA